MNESMASETNLTADGTTRGNAFARYLPHTARILMGIVFFVFGLNGFLSFIPRPKAPMPEVAVTFLGALMKTGYMMPPISRTQVIVGALLLSNRFVPLALALIAPVIVNIVAFHAFVAPRNVRPRSSPFPLASARQGLRFLAWNKRNWRSISRS